LLGDDLGLDALRVAQQQIALPPSAVCRRLRLAL
jgi:hypothetical protein